MNPKNRDFPGDNLKKITDYFTRRKSSDVGSTQALSTPTPRTSLGRRVSQKGEESGTLIKSSRISKLSQRTESNASTLSKRMRSPDAVPRSKATAASPGMKRSKRQRKFDSDSDVDMTDLAVIYVKSPRRPGSPDKPCPMGHTFIKRCETVPTSQSDELELDLARDIMVMERDAREVQKSVERWRQQATPNAADEPRNEDSHMRDVNTPVSSPLSSVPLTPKFLSSETNSGSLLPGLPTPPVSADALARSPSITLLGEKIMTEHLLEKIKSDAFARAQRLEDSPPPQFDEFLDSSSDEEEFSFAILAGSKGKTGRSFDCGEAIAGPSKSAVGQRHSLRNRTPKAILPKIASPSEKRSSALRKEAQPKEVIPGKLVTKTYNPLDALLSEKRKLEKSGKGTEAFLQAESALELIRAWEDEDAGNDEILEKWQDEGAVRNVIQEMLTNDQSYFEENDAQDVSLDAEGATKLFGINGSKVADILKRDRTMEDPVHVMLDGPRLWVEFGNDSQTHMPISLKNHTFHYSGVHPVISVLKASLDEQDFAQVISILDSGILASIDLSICESLLLFLIEQAFSPTPDILALPSFHSLLSIYADPSSSAARFNSTWLFRILTFLGAEPTVMKLMGYCADDVNPIFLDVGHRADFVLRLLHVLKTVTRSQKIEVNDIPDIIIALQRIALDSSASHQVRLDVTNLVGDLCNLATPETEMRIYEKATPFISALGTPCTTQILSMFSRGSGAARRIARWLAYSTLANQVFAERFVEPVPPLNGLLDIVESSDVFQIHDASDYMTLWHYVRILSIALTDVELYDAAERNVSDNSAELRSPDKRKNKHKILLIHEALERLHAMIQDTRALHLDRSRVKAAIKQLSLRLRYQHSDFAHHAAGKPRRRTLDHFFTPKKR